MALKKSTHLKEIQKRLPEDLVLVVETKFSFTDDEYIAILSWIKWFNTHYEKYGKEELPGIISPLVSFRVRIDFGLYNQPCTLPATKGLYIVYLCKVYNQISETRKMTTNQLISHWAL